MAALPIVTGSAASTAVADSLPTGPVAISGQVLDINGQTIRARTA